MSNSMILYGDVVFSKSRTEMEFRKNNFLVIEDGIVQGVFEEIPNEYSDLEVVDYSNRIIMPGMTDLHVHAPQYSFRGLGMDLELLDWLDKYAFNEERKYVDEEYAHDAYSVFVNDLKNSMTTRACIFGTIHSGATFHLMELLEETGLKTMVGKVNMDRQSPQYLCEVNASISARDTEIFVKQALSHFINTKPIITPRFVPSCSDELFERLSMIRKKYNLPVQSHLSENLSEIELVSNLNKKSKFYGDAYDMFGMFGGDYKAIMAHCVYSMKEEVDLMKRNNVYVAHCPDSNMNLASGIAPVRQYIEDGLNIGLGTDIGAGYSISMFKAIVDTVQASKLYWRLIDQSKAPISIKEAFYLATVGGGSFFGKVGTFMKGYEADVVVLDDNTIKASYDMSLEERFERTVYMADMSNIEAKYVSGVEVIKKENRVNSDIVEWN